MARPPSLSGARSSRPIIASGSRKAVYGRSAMSRRAPFKAVLFDAYGTLIRNEDLILVPRQIVADYGLSVHIEDVLRTWSELYHETTQLEPFRTLREIEELNLSRLLRRFEIGADATPYVELFFKVTTTVELYPETLDVLNALGHVRRAVLSNADLEHLAAWNFTLPVEFILVSETLRAYKPHRLVFQKALEQLGLPSQDRKSTRLNSS